MRQPHPFRIIRLANDLTLAAVAESCSVTPQVVMRSEQGLYGIPTSKLTCFLAGLEGSPNSGDLEKAYKDWQVQTRLYNRNKIEPQIRRIRAEFPHRKFTLPQFRVELNAGSVVGMCKLLCVHPSQVDRYTRKGGSLFFLEEALRDCCEEGLVKWVTSHLRPS